jgi:hypothetical protein
MQLWIWVLGGTALAAAAVALFVAMGQAERRARRTLFRALGLDASTVELLMSRNGDVLAELTLVRRQDLAPPAPEPKATEPEIAAERPRPSIRLVHPAPDQTADPTPSSDPGRPDDDHRRLGLPGRH